ncbi:hypothetical protein BH23PLA1_BH23PLA1_01510 [soil metagenome]
MKTIDLAAQPLGLEDLLKLASKGGVILRTEDGKEFLLAEVDDLEEEVARIRQRPELLEFLEQRSLATRTHSLSDVRKALGLDP